MNCINLSELAKLEICFGIHTGKQYRKDLFDRIYVTTVIVSSQWPNLPVIDWLVSKEYYSTQLISQHIDGLVQERRNSSALAMELRLSCTKPSISSKREQNCYCDMISEHYLLNLPEMFLVILCVFWISSWTLLLEMIGNVRKYGLMNLNTIPLS